MLRCAHYDYYYLGNLLELLFFSLFQQTILSSGVKLQAVQLLPYTPPHLWFFLSRSLMPNPQTAVGIFETHFLKGRLGVGWNRTCWKNVQASRSGSQPRTVHRAFVGVGRRFTVQQFVRLFISTMIP